MGSGTLYTVSASQAQQGPHRRLSEAGEIASPVEVERTVEMLESQEPPGGRNAIDSEVALVSSE